MTTGTEDKSTTSTTKIKRARQKEGKRACGREAIRYLKQERRHEKKRIREHFGRQEDKSIEGT
jgi:hypothetical protein